MTDSGSGRIKALPVLNSPGLLVCDYDMTVDKYASLKLENQLCFPLYAVSKEIIRRYKPSLDKLDLTYTQYITMMVMWEKKQVNVKELGEKLLLDSGTLTPVLKKLEHKGYITRERSRASRTKAWRLKTRHFLCRSRWHAVSRSRKKSPKLFMLCCTSFLRIWKRTVLPQTDYCCMSSI